MTVYLAFWGWTSLKPLCLYTTHDACAAREHLGCSKSAAIRVLQEAGVRTPLYRLGARSTKRTRTGEGGAAVRTGWRDAAWINKTQDQAASKEYPPKFCESVANLIICALPAA
eukprot:2952782-Pyramimonas_sp.AAC.1